MCTIDVMRLVILGLCQCMAPRITFSKKFFLRDGFPGSCLSILFFSAFMVIVSNLGRLGRCNCHHFQRYLLGFNWSRVQGEAMARVPPEKLHAIQSQVLQLLVISQSNGVVEGKTLQDGGSSTPRHIDEELEKKE